MKQLKWELEDCEAIVAPSRYMDDDSPLCYRVEPDGAPSMPQWTATFEGAVLHTGSLLCCVLACEFDNDKHK